MSSPDMSTAREKAIRITVTSVMQGVKQTIIAVPEGINVMSLKIAIEQATDVTVDKQILLYKGKELKMDDEPISAYGIVSDSQITMNVKMSTGLFSKPTATDFIFLAPPILPDNQDQLRKTIKGMNSVNRKPKKMSDVDETAKIWTPEKQLEAELTRNRMKTLLRRKKKDPILSNGGTPVDSEPASVQSYSPVATPPSELASPTPLGSTQKMAEVTDVPVTEKELKLFFDPSETIEEYRRNRRNLYLPPSNLKELQGYVNKFAEDRKTKCNLCLKKLSAAQQTMHCKCKKLFCDKHRNPDQHLCVIDYKQDGRIKLKKENSKCGENGERKAKFAADSEKKTKSK